MTIIPLMLSDKWHNKTNLLGHDGGFLAFAAMNVTLEQLAAHIVSGKAWRVGLMGRFKRHRVVNQKSRRLQPIVRHKKLDRRGINIGRLPYRPRRANFIASRLLALDFDDGNVSVESALQHPFIQQYAALVHPSPSSTPETPKTRVVFMLSEIVKGAGRWEALQTALVTEFADLRPDMGCKNCDRKFNGSDLPGWVFRPDVVLPLSVAAGLTATQAQRDYDIYKTPRSAPSGHASKNWQEVEAEVERIVGADCSSVDASGRCRKAVACCMCNHSDDERHPAFFWYPDKKIGFCYKCEARFGKGMYLTKDIAAKWNVEMNAKKNRMAIRAPKALPTPQAETLKTMLRRSEKHVEEAVDFMQHNGVMPAVTRSRLVGALKLEKSLGEYKFPYTRYVVPHFWQDELFGARLYLDRISVQRAWFEFEEAAPHIFTTYRQQMGNVKDYTPEYWHQVYKIVGGDGFIEERRTYNVQLVLERKNEKIIPRPNTGVMIFANNDEIGVLTALSNGYNACGATPQANLEWMFSGAQHRLVVGYKQQEQLVTEVAKKAKAYAIAWLDAPINEMVGRGTFSKLMEKYRLFPVLPV